VKISEIRGNLFKNDLDSKVINKKGQCFVVV